MINHTLRRITMHDYQITFIDNTRMWIHAQSWPEAIEAAKYCEPRLPIHSCVPHRDIAPAMPQRHILQASA